MTYIQEIKNKYPESVDWPLKYPWFATGRLVDAKQHQNEPEFETASQKAAVFLNNIPRLHWLLNQPNQEEVQITTTKNSAGHSSLSHSVAALPTEEVLQPHTDNKEEKLQINTRSEDFEPPQQLPQQVVDPPASLPVSEEEELPTSPLSATLAAAADRFKNDPGTDDSLLIETAYQHTIDYFASQGIRLEGEPAHDDRFGQQLKTFTSWLRQMKRLPDAQVPDSDASVETQAAHSLHKGEVLTEPMVDILLKQGKKQQALLVLEKLRLLHPEKSLYFAARSEQIKQS